MRAYKLLRRRRDGSLGPLFINRALRVPVGQWIEAGCHPTKGYALRPGWHCCSEKRAPHLRQGGDRVWAQVEVGGQITEFQRPWNQGGLWLLATRMKVIQVDREET